MNIQVIIPMVIFLAIIFFIGFWSSKKLESSTGGFLQEYFLGGRELGGFVLAMTMVATYGSASSFLGGPGTAYTMGFGWVLLAMTQVVTVILCYLFLGKSLLF